MLFFSFNEILFSNVWEFIRSFIYGAIGGLAAISMSYINNESTSVNLRNTALMKSFINGTSQEKQKKLQERLEEIRKPTRSFIFQAAMVHAFIGGISGMIAVSAFNPTANELQTFSIAVIAGVSGFAFLKRSALIDDKLSEKMLDVEKEAIEMSLENNEVIQIVEELSSSSPEILDEVVPDNLLDQLVDDEPLIEFTDIVEGSEYFEAYINDLKEEVNITNTDINQLRTYFYKNRIPLDQIMEFVDERITDHGDL